MCVDKPSAMVYATGGKGSPILIGWSYGTQQEKEEAICRPILKKKYNQNYSFHIAPITINRKGRIIRYKSS
jgi:hypothetical protein